VSRLLGELGELNRMDFDGFFRDNYARVHRAMCLSFSDSEFAEEVTQEAFYRALRSWPKVSKLDHPEAWTMVVALNRGRDLLRRRRRDLDKAPTLSRGTLQDPMESNVQDRLEVVDLLTKVSERQRTVLVLRYVAQLRVSEIAEVLHCAEGTVKSTLHAALARAAQEKKGRTHVRD
jgi:RNA polymerase sigma factor (sigma-70 family)